MRILVTGASGLIGKNFIRQALLEGHEVSALVRNPQKFRMLPEKRIFQWSHHSLPEEKAFNNIDAVVHLAGENIADGRWSKKRKKLLVDSRLEGTKNLVSVLSHLPADKRPKVLLSSSAIGYYGYQQDGTLTESASPGNDFLANLCRDWEQEALNAQKCGMRVVLLRTGIVLSKEGGALAKMPPVQVSNGKNWMSWIHVEDMVRIILFSLGHEKIKGPINCVAPQPVQNREFTKELAKVKGIPSIGFVPRIFLSLGLGELSNVIVSNLRIQPQNLLDAEFKFTYPDLRSALERELKGDHLIDSYLFKDQFIPLKPEEIFPFFSQAENLETLTPPWLNFRITAKSTSNIGVGTVIDYKLKVHGVPIGWRSLIKNWEKNEYFVDEQIKGPYAKWHHLHLFERVSGGCLLRDKITYRAPASFFGFIFLSYLISKDINQIFEYRQNRIQELLASGKIK